jgi:nitroreductase
MDFATLIKNRYSVRGYQSDPVEQDKLEQVLEAARLAPTAANRQPFRIVVAQTEGRKDEMQRLYDKDWFLEAPLVICVSAVKSEAWVSRGGMNYVYVDVAIVMDHIILAATDLGLGTCWIGAFDKDVAREIFHLPDDLEPVVMTTLGYAGIQPEPKERRSIDELVRYEMWEKA